MMRPSIAAVALTCLGSLCAARASAGDASSPTEGTRVRVTASGLATGRLVGELVGIDADRIVVQQVATSELVTIPRGDVTQVEVATAKRRRGAGVKLGALFGLGIGAALGFAVGDDCGAPDAPTIVCIPREGAAVGLGLTGAGVGALLGLAFSPQEMVWRPVDADGLQVGVMPSASPSGGLGLKVSVGF
jgi:hypothetical protein